MTENGKVDVERVVIVKVPDERGKEWSFERRGDDVTIRAPVSFKTVPVKAEHLARGLAELGLERESA